MQAPAKHIAAEVKRQPCDAWQGDRGYGKFNGVTGTITGRNLNTSGTRMAVTTINSGKTRHGQCKPMSLDTSATTKRRQLEDGEEWATRSSSACDPRATADSKSRSQTAHHGSSGTRIPECAAA